MLDVLPVDEIELSNELVSVDVPEVVNALDNKLLNKSAVPLLALVEALEDVAEVPSKLEMEPIDDKSIAIFSPPFQKWLL